MDDQQGLGEGEVAEEDKTAGVGVVAEPEEPDTDTSDDEAIDAG